MANDEIKLETRFSRSRGLFPYVAGIVGIAVLAVIVMVATGVGLDFLPYGEYFAVHAPTAPDGSPALSLVMLHHADDEKSLSVDGIVMNRTDSAITGLVAVISVTDRFTLPAQTVNVPVDPVELSPKGMGTFQTTVPLGENGLGGYSVQFRLPDEGPFVPHKDDRPPEPPPPADPPAAPASPSRGKAPSR
jgi:hypothetical protein